MIRDTFFNMHRFVGLCRKEMVESWKVNMLRAVMMYGIMAIAFVWNGYFQYRNPENLIREGVVNDPIWVFELAVSLWAIVIMGMLSASFTMERMKSKTNRIATLMTPATMFEKFFSRWLVFTFGFLVVFLIAFKLADWTRLLVYTVSFPELGNIIAATPLSHLVGDEQYWTAFSDCSSFMLGVSAYFLAQSVFVLGSTVWPKNAFVKTFSAVVVIGILFVSIGATLSNILINGPVYGPVVMTDADMTFLTTIIFFVVAVFNTVLAYFRFKESEIINRW